MAFYGRSACRQGAHLALTRQLGSVRAALPTGAVIVGCFADVCAWDGWAETSCADLSICTGWVLDTHTIEGGLATVLRRARRPVPDLEVLACEDTDRLSRRTFRRTLIEDALEACGLGLVFAADGPRGLLPLAAELASARDTIGRAARRLEGPATWPLPS